MARPRKEFNVKIFEQLCALQCTLAEIALVMNLSEDTIENRCDEIYQRRFTDVFEQKRVAGFTSLRRAQFKMAETVPALAIFLGKNYLNQSDKIAIDVKQLDSDIERELALLAARGEAGSTGETESESVN